jgi:hypothetical protein
MDWFMVVCVCLIVSVGMVAGSVGFLATEAVYEPDTIIVHEACVVQAVYRNTTLEDKDAIHDWNR